MLPNSCRGLLLHLALVCGAGGRSWVVESYDGEAAAKKRKGGGEWWTAHRVATVPGAKGADWRREPAWDGAREACQESAPRRVVSGGAGWGEGERHGTYLNDARRVEREASSESD